jgi:reactive intermediate/imine deaminase
MMETDLIKENQMSRQVIHTENAPAAIGTYSQAILVGNTLYLSGQIGLDPYSMELVEGIEAQIRRVFDNLKAVCEAAGGSLADIAKLNIFLTDLSNFQLVNQIMGEYFAQPYPARAALGVASLPKGALVEMDGIIIINQ